MWQASYLPEGAISGLGYVHRLLSFSIMNIVNSFLIVFLPVSAVAFARNDIEQLKAGTEKLLLNFFTISVFLSAFIILNNETVVRLIYERGMFGEDSARLVSGLLYCYLPWILFFPLSNVAVRIFYVYKDYKNLTFVSAGGLLLTLTLAPFLRGWIGVNGLGLMASGHMMCYCLALLFLVHKRYFKIDFPAILKNSLVNAGLAGAIISIMLFLKSCALSDPYTLLGTSLFFLIPVALWRLNRSLDLASILKNRL
jgi:peptidoglycan biosynthesis protein MviN/MurJ (putative lipid II flippase)